MQKEPALLQKLTLIHHVSPQTNINANKTRLSDDLTPLSDFRPKGIPTPQTK